MDVDALSAAGLYDPQADDAAERLELLAFLAEIGCDIEEMVAAHERGRLFALAGDRIIRPDRDRYTLDEVAELLGRDPAFVARLWRALGLVSTPLNQGVASPSDVETLRTLCDMGDIVGVGVEVVVGVARVAGSAMSRVSDAVSMAVRQRTPDLSIATSHSELRTATTFAAVAQAVPRVGAALDTLFRHHLENWRMHFERSDSYDVSLEGGVRIAVGFADLSGFTELSERLSLDALSRLMSAFEEISYELVGTNNGRVVKFLGDAVMYVAPDADCAAEIAFALVNAASDRGLDARAGIAHGLVLSLDGDYFGPVVNAAARLVALAGPGEVLATSDLADQLTRGAPSQPLGPQQLRGFADPTPVSRLVPVG